MECMFASDFVPHWKDVRLVRHFDILLFSLSPFKQHISVDSKGHLRLWFWINHVANSVKLLGIFWVLGWQQLQSQVIKVHTSKLQVTYDYSWTETIRQVETARNLFFSTFTNLWRRESPLIRAVYNLLREAERRAQSVWSSSPTWPIGKSFHLISLRGTNNNHAEFIAPFVLSVNWRVLLQVLYVFELNRQIALK